MIKLKILCWGENIRAYRLWKTLKYPYVLPLRKAYAREVLQRGVTIDRVILPSFPEIGLQIYLNELPDESIVNCPSTHSYGGTLNAWSWVGSKGVGPLVFLNLKVKE